MVVLRHVQCMAITLTLSHDRNITLSRLIYPARDYSIVITTVLSRLLSDYSDPDCPTTMKVLLHDYPIEIASLQSLYFRSSCDIVNVCKTAVTYQNFQPVFLFTFPV